MDIVNEILKKNDESEDLLKSIKVHKDIELDIDEGLLLASDYNVFDKNKLSTHSDNYLKSLTRDNVQLLINKIWELPTQRVEEAIVAKLPKPKYVLPRARRIPKPKPLTKWEQYAKEKGIRKKKKGQSKKKWDELLKQWVPTYGYQRAKAEKQKEWLVELNEHNDVKEDAFTVNSNSKRERVSKNELQRLRNLAKSKNVKVPQVGLPSTEHFRDSRQLGTAVTVARASTASVGKFQDRLPKEKDAKDIATQVPGLKRKHEAPPANAVEEKKRNRNIVDAVLTKNTKLINFDMPSTNSNASSKRSGNKKGSKKNKTVKKPKAGKGKRDLHTKVGGRKRRQ